MPCPFRLPGGEFMSWQTMSAELAGQAPVDYLFAQTLVNRAWLNVQRKHLWSFLWGKRPIPTPVPTAGGTVTLVRGQPTVVGDAAARAAWALVPLVTPLGQQQFRVGQGTIYNVLTYQDNVPPGFATLTLDQPYVDPQAGAGIQYLLMQNYYLAPVPDFLWWESIVDPISGYALRTTLTNEEVDIRDPQRFLSGWPVGPLPYQVNPQPGPTFGFPMYELWPGPLNGIVYVGSYFRRGTLFVLDTDLVNPMLGEDVVLALAKVHAYEWALAQKDLPAAAKKGWQFALGYAQKEYAGLLSDYITKDEEFSHRHVINAADSDYLNTLPWVSQREGVMFAP